MLEAVQARMCCCFHTWGRIVWFEVPGFLPELKVDLKGVIPWALPAAVPLARCFQTSVCMQWAFAQRVCCDPGIGEFLLGAAAP